MDGKEYSPALDALDRIELADREEGMFLGKPQEILIGAANPAGLIDLDRFLFALARPHTDGSGHIDVPRGEQPIVDISVQGPFRDHRLIPMLECDVVEGLPFAQEGRDDLVEMGELLLRDGKAGPCLRP